MARGWALWLVLCGLMGCGLVACGGDRDPRAAGVLYACKTQDDCLEGYSCFCGLCQVPGQAAVCLGDASPTDASPTDASPVDGAADSSGPGGDAADLGSDLAADSEDAAAEVADSADVSSPADSAEATGACHLVTWAGCTASQGCYYDQLASKTLCAAHGSQAWGSACDPAKTPQCGLGQVGGSPRPLICDAVDKKCYFTCTCQGTGPACPTGQTCYCLTDAKQQPFPDSAGICVP